MEASSQKLESTGETIDAVIKGGAQGEMWGLEQRWMGDTDRERERTD